jgi:hypothetical protein
MSPSEHADTAQLIHKIGDALHDAAAALQAGDEKRASTLLRDVLHAVQAGEPAQDWPTLRLLLEPHVARLRGTTWPFTEPVADVLNLDTWEASGPMLARIPRQED